LERVVGVTAGDGAPVEIVEGAPDGAPGTVMPNGGVGSRGDPVAGACETETDVRLVEGVGEGLVEAADGDQGLAAKGAVAAGDRRDPVVAVESRPLAREVACNESLQPVVRGGAALELGLRPIPDQHRPPARAERRIERERGGEGGEPPDARGKRVVIDEGDEVARGGGDAQIARATQV